MLSFAEKIDCDGIAASYLLKASNNTVEGGAPFHPKVHTIFFVF